MHCIVMEMDMHTDQWRPKRDKEAKNIPATARLRGSLGVTRSDTY